MPTARPPLQVEVVTKIPVKTGLGLADPGITGGISRTVATAQTTAARSAVDVVTDVPGQLRNITPLTFGQKAAEIGKIGVKIGTKVVGVGLGVVANLAQDLLFPEPVGLGSDMVGGIKIGSQPTASAPQTAAGATQPIAKPQISTAPFKPSAPAVAAPAAKPASQTQTQTKPQTQPLPAPATTQPQSAPTQARPKPQPISISTPEPRPALETPLPSRPKPLKTESPFPLNTVDLNSYGGVNLTYPIAQKLITIPQDIKNLLQPDLDYIEEKLDSIPQTFEEILKRARIETTVNLPAKIDLISQIPLQLDLSKQVPVAVDLSKQIPVAIDLSKQVPVAIDIASQLPFTIDLSKQVPVTVDLTKQIPVTADLTSKIPLAINLDSQIPFKVDLSKTLSATTDLTAKLPFNLDLSKQVPVTVDLSKKIPVTVDLSTLLQPDSETTSLKSLQECCEEIQKILKKKAEIFEGKGELACGKGTTPYSYRGEGLNGIHQLIKIVLGANKQILEKICDLKIEYPLIEGSGVYNCGTFPPTSYHYSGLGFLGIQNQVEQLFSLDKKILNEVCSITEISSLPNISGKIEYFDCAYNTQVILYSGNGIEGLSKQVDALSTLVKVGVKAACDSGSIVVMPDARFEEFRTSRQLMITWGTDYPTQNGSLWQTYLPNPVDNLEWCKNFENLSTTKGNVYGRVQWENSKIATGIYCDTEEEVYRILRIFTTLSNATPTLDEEGLPQITIQKGKSSKRKSLERSVRAVRAAITEIGPDGNPSSVKCFTPPPEGCLPVII